MSEILKIALTAFGAICVFVLGQIISKFFIEPIYEQRKTIGSVVDALIFNANWISSPTDSDPTGGRRNALAAIRQCACSLLAKTYGVPLYKLWARIGIVPKLNIIIESHNELTFLSNNLSHGTPKENRESVRKIKRLLKIDF